MTSGGNLVRGEAFRGCESVLSGPAGGVVALGKIAKALEIDRAIGLDMGGTSTDVSRFDGRVGRRLESRLAGVQILAPTMDIHTVAAGGGSICGVRDGRLHVGPQSAGAEPGPACYGRGGPLTLTDVNVVLGRLPEERFPIPVDSAAAHAAIGRVRETLPEDMAGMTVESLAKGFLQIAVTEMAQAVRMVMTTAGDDPREMTLVGFGGAAGGHLCRIAEELGITDVVDHPRAGVLSAVGIGTAPVGRIATRAVDVSLSSPKPRAVAADVAATLRRVAEEVTERCRGELAVDCGDPQGEELDAGELSVDLQVDARYTGTQATLPLPLEPVNTLASRFEQLHRATFGYTRGAMGIETSAIRCEATSSSDRGAAFVRGGMLDNRPAAGKLLSGPAVISSGHSVLVIEPGWSGEADEDGLIRLRRQGDDAALAEQRDDAVAMEVVARRVQTIAETMGEVIRRTSVSVNVKERRDYSCAVFLGDGRLVANAPHVPVHLGAMGHTVRSLTARYPRMFPGDVYVSNHPFAGGSHLPDVTVVTPVFVGGESTSGGRPDFFVASRCHHAEIGGTVPGSMPPAATSLAEEGVVIDGVALMRDGVSGHEALRTLLLSGPHPSRNVEENLADIAAAQAAGGRGAAELTELATSMPQGRLTVLLQRLLSVAGRATERWIDSLAAEARAQRPVSRSFADALDDGTPIRVRMTPQTDGVGPSRLIIDFAGTGKVHPHGFNATPAIVTAAVLYVLRCVSGSDLPLCDGVLERIDLRIPRGLLNPPAAEDARQCAAVVAGNVETSNRVVDVLLGALGAAAASQGTMNNLLIGDATFGYYETIGGGAGATDHLPGADALHTHMTNTRMTDPEVLESRLPLRLRQFAIRRDSGGKGRQAGGCGLIREIEFLRPLTVSMISSRRESVPYGLAGGKPGAAGRQMLFHAGRWSPLPACFTCEVACGDRLRIETPGGGGYGTLDFRKTTS